MTEPNPQGATPETISVERAKRRLLLNPIDPSLFDDTGNPPKRWSLINDGPLEVRAVPVINIDPYSNPVKMQLQNPTVFKTLALITAAGDTAIWTPTTGKKFRLMGLQIYLATGTTAAAASEISIKDGSTVILNYAMCGVALVAFAIPGVCVADLKLPGMGYLSAAANNVLNLNLSSVLAVGGVSVNAWGTEE